MMKWLVPLVCLLLIVPGMVCAQGVSEVEIPAALGHYQAPVQNNFSIDISREARNVSSLGVFWLGTQTRGVFVDENVPNTDISLAGVLIVNLFDPAGHTWTCKFFCMEPFVEDLGDGNLRAARLFESETGTSLAFLRDGAVDMEVNFSPLTLTATQTIVTQPEMDVTDFKLDLTGGVVDAESETWGSVKALYN